MKAFYGKWKRTKSGELIWKWKKRKVKPAKLALQLGDHIELLYAGPIQGIRQGHELTLVQIDSRWHQLDEPQEITVNGRPL